MNHDETLYRPDVIPAVCGNGHRTYPASIVMRDQAEANLRTDASLSPCPACGGSRVLPAGRYKVDAGGMVLRAGDA